MNEINSNQAGILDDEQGDGRKRKLLIQSDLEGRMCPHCGSRRYTLVFRMIRGRYIGLLAARCSCCRQPRSLMRRELLPMAYEKREVCLDRGEGTQSEHNG